MVSALERRGKGQPGSSGGSRPVLETRPLLRVEATQSEYRHEADAKLRERMPRRKRKLLAERRIVRQEEISIAAEVDHIVKRAIAGQSCVVSFGRLVFFATASRDAWLLDADDDLALELARAGRRLPVTITESPERFTIEWDGTFRIDGEVMSFTNALGCARSAIGYPVREIATALDRARR